jgi:excisionase family DNA binding protein
MSEGLAFYTAEELADLLRLNHQVVQRKLQAGEIPGYKIGKEWRVEKAQLLAWLERHSNQRDPLDRFFTDEGRLTKLPAGRPQRQAVLKRLVAEVPAGRAVKEAELNEILRRHNDDVATIRREMVMEGLLVRSTRGVYKRPNDDEPVLRRA